MESPKILQLIDVWNLAALIYDNTNKKFENESLGPQTRRRRTPSEQRKESPSGPRARIFEETL